MGKDVDSKVPVNCGKPPIEVFLCSLLPYAASMYRSKCPLCEDGLLTFKRDMSHDLEDWDACIRCGQIYKYHDAVYFRMWEYSRDPQCLKIMSDLGFVEDARDREIAAVDWTITDTRVDIVRRMKSILNRIEILPLLIGINAGLDRVIEKALRNRYGSSPQ